MALLALSYPTISAAHQAWVQSIRRAHDPQVDLVMPHFTLVFPTAALDHTHFARHIRQQVQGHKPITFTLRCAIVVKDPFSDDTHTFLVPDEGFSDVVKLHDALYAGDLAGELRLDLPFIPHITVAAARDSRVCKRIANEINATLHGADAAIRGTLRHIDVVQFVNHTVTTLAQIPLGERCATA